MRESFYPPLSVYIIYTEDLGSRLPRAPQIKVYRLMQDARHAMENEIYDYQMNGYYLREYVTHGEYCVATLVGKYRVIQIRCELKLVQ